MCNCLFNCAFVIGEVCVCAFSRPMLSRCVVFGQHTCQDVSSYGRGTIAT